MSTNYVIAVWSGLRRVNPPKVVQEREIFLKRHLDSLQKLKHKLDQVTIIFSKNPQEPESFRKFRATIPDRIGSAKVVLMDRPNVGYSYGAYNDVFKAYGKSFDHYLLMEDDYCFLKDDFDAQMHAKLAADEKCGMVTFVLEKGKRDVMVTRATHEAPGGVDVGNLFAKYCPEKFLWPRVMLGLARADALQGILDQFGELPHAKGTNHTECKFLGQFSLPIVMQKLGWKVADMLPDVRVEAFGPGGERLCYGPGTAPLVVTSIQFLL
jgi:hypothetical protein